ncbi:hypothetical protein [Streptomyces showdoensis]|uniref:hypothetical protein n=1 Tax=Streptomyces showdoensis TaxID=68268 RepID=UPI0013F4CAB4|nr:hypothetical protein [Streptomyces showdoensis]
MTLRQGQAALPGPSRITVPRPLLGGHRERHRVPFGKALAPPDPFGFDLETADFVRIGR